MRHLVIGAGVVGLSTAWELTRRGERPLVVDRFARGHRHGASHGSTRNFNNAYAEPHYLDLLARAKDGWDALGETEGAPVLRLHGLVTQGRSSELERVHRALAERGIPAELIAAAEATRRWPGMRFDEAALFSPEAGVVRAEAAMREFERRIAQGGGEVRFDTPVARIDDEGPGNGVAVTLAGDAGVLRADVVVLAAGAWTAGLAAAAGLSLPMLTVTEESPAHFRPRDPAVRWPSFNHFVDPDAYPGAVYGMPSPAEGIKVGFHRVGDVVDPDARTYRPAAGRLAQLTDYVREWMPGLDAADASPISCTYTSTHDGAFILDRRGNLVVGAGFSGHGYKFAPGIGGVLADLAQDTGDRPAAAFLLPEPVR